MTDEFGLSACCQAPLRPVLGPDYDGEIRQVLACTASGCLNEWVDIGPAFHPVQVIASTREAEEQRRCMSESEQEALIRWRKGWGAW